MIRHGIWTSSRRCGFCLPDKNGNVGMKIGFIGLGRMGHHVAANLLKAGHSVTVWNRSQDPVMALVAKGAAAAATPQEALQGDAVFSMLSNDQVMRDVGL